MLLQVALQLCAAVPPRFADVPLTEAKAGLLYLSDGGSRVFEWTECESEWVVYAPNGHRPAVATLEYGSARRWSAGLADTVPTVGCPSSRDYNPALGVALHGVKFGGEPCINASAGTASVKVVATGPYAFRRGEREPTWAGLVGWHVYYRSLWWYPSGWPLLGAVATLGLLWAIQGFAAPSSAAKVAEQVVVVLWFSALLVDFERYVSASGPSLDCSGADLRERGAAGFRGAFAVRVVTGLLGLAVPVWHKRAPWAAAVLLVPALFYGAGYVAAPLLTAALCWTV